MKHIFTFLAASFVVCATTMAGPTNTPNPVIAGLSDISLTKSLRAVPRTNQPTDAEVVEIAQCVENFRTGRLDTIEGMRKRIARLGSPAIPALLRLLEHPNGNISGNALVSLYFIAPQQAFPLVVTNLDNEAPCFMDADVLGDTVGTVAWCFLHESIDQEWPFADVRRRVPVATRTELKEKLLTWFSSIRKLEPQSIHKYGWPKVTVVERGTDNNLLNGTSEPARRADSLDR